MKLYYQSQKPLKTQIRAVRRKGSKKMKKEYWFLIAAGLFILGAGVVETMPLVSVLALVGMIAAVISGKLWTVEK